MTDGKVSAAHLRRKAVIYVRQSSASQLERNKESTERQYALADRAAALGWPRSAVHVIDADLGVSGAVTSTRSGFAELTAQVALGEIGLVLALEVSRLARSNSDWYRLLDVAGMTDTLIGDADGLYHPGLFNDRMLLGLKGTMSEAELHVLRARLDGGIRNKAARGELRRALPVGLAWGEEEGEILLHPDEAVTGVIAAIFARFAECGSARATWLWLREQGLSFPLQRTGEAEIRWVVPTYHAVHKVLTHPAYAGAYAYGKTRHERFLDDNGQLRTRVRRLPRDQWQVLLPDHHAGFIDWPTFEANQARIGQNTRPDRHGAGTGAVREGCALLQGLAVCGHCGRKIAVHYRGKHRATPGYHCHGAELVAGRGQRCLTVGGVQIDAAVAGAFLAAIEPAALEACLAAADELETGHDTALAQWRREVERARFQAAKAERRYLAVDPDNRLVARGLEAEWERTLTALAAAEAELTRRETRRPTTLTVEERAGVLALGDDLPGVWHAPTTTDRDRKEVLHTLLEEVVISLDRHSKRADLTLRWKGGALTDLTVALPRSQPPKVRTSDDTVDLVRRLAVHYPDAVIAGILNRQGRTTARGLPFDYNRVNNLRNHWKIPRHRPDDAPPADEPEPLSIKQAAKELEVAPSTLHRWLNDGFIAGEQITPGAPWRIRLTDDLRSRFTDQAPPGWLPMLEATLALGVSRQTVLQRVKRGELEAVHVRSGRRKGLRIKLPVPADSLF
ncbi:recombinase family protein [Streptomyces sp. NBC_01320]|uniref:recombinase family protein n=1 Tax=Streptomyces sp. NBC_01320 TaxID=2903824 RepID=UPI002E12795B|nr:recombinase family protein [Streptomyces sp. NBC_01320]